MSVFSLTFRRLRVSVRSLPRITATLAAYKHKLCCYRFQELLPATGIQLKNYCSKPGASEIDIAYYDEIKSLPDHPEKLLIDVREPEELKETGKIPTSINIPLAEVRDALSVLDVKTFKNLYGIEKPSKEKNIIFYCMIGKRSHKASEIALQLGYKNVKNYLGSWSEWVEHERN